MEEFQEGDVTILRITGRLDAVAAPCFEQKLEALIIRGCARVVVDFETLELIVSAGLRVFLSFAKRCKKTGGKMALCQMQPAVWDVFRISGFTEIMAIYPGRTEAVGAVLS